MLNVQHELILIFLYKMRISMADNIDYILLQQKASSHFQEEATYGAGDGNRTHVTSLEGWSSTIELHPRFWSGRRGSDSRPPPWQGGALPTELLPRKAGDFGVKEDGAGEET